VALSAQARQPGAASEDPAVAQALCTEQRDRMTPRGEIDTAPNGISVASVGRAPLSVFRFRRVGHGSTG